MPYPIDPKQLPSAAESLPPEPPRGPGDPLKYANDYLYQLWADIDAAITANPTTITGAGLAAIQAAMTKSQAH
jgi:hypothetical protein